MQKKRLGQVFLVDQNILNKIILAADVSKTDHVVEIGCGNGILSAALAERAAHLSIIEIDPHFLGVTSRQLEGVSTVTFIQEDVLKTDFFQKLNGNCKIVANIPYYISAKFVKLMILYREKISRSVVMVQKEFAHKLFAQPGSDDYTSLSVYSQFYLQGAYLFDVSRRSFRPQPGVDSAVIELMARQVPLFALEFPDLFFAIVRSAFWGRRKPLVSCLAKSPYIQLKPGFQDVAFFQSYPGIRGEMLSLDGFYQVYSALVSGGFVL